MTPTRQTPLVGGLGPMGCASVPPLAQQLHPGGRRDTPTGPTSTPIFCVGLGTQGAAVVGLLASAHGHLPPAMLHPSVPGPGPGPRSPRSPSLQGRPEAGPAPEAEEGAEARAAQGPLGERPLLLLLWAGGKVGQGQGLGGRGGEQLQPGRIGLSAALTPPPRRQELPIVTQEPEGGLWSTMSPSSSPTPNG